MEISRININGKAYKLVDKASSDALIKMNEPYLPFPSLSTTSLLGFSEEVNDGFDVRDLLYCYYFSTNPNRILYTKAGNIIPPNFVILTEYLSNRIYELDENEVITIHYGN